MKFAYIQSLFHKHVLPLFLLRENINMDADRAISNAKIELKNKIYTFQLVYNLI